MLEVSNVYGCLFCAYGNILIIIENDKLNDLTFGNIVEAGKISFPTLIDKNVKYLIVRYISIL
jgi:hypothetical protein